VDPFLLAAVAYRQSRGAPSPRHGHRGGLITIDWKEHAPFIRGKRYRYSVLEDDRWIPRELDVAKHPFTPRDLRRSAPSVYFGAAILRVYQEQCPAIDTRLGSVPHRHPVSHLIWGDAVPDAGSEERLLTDRRRLIQYYQQTEPKPVGRLAELKLYCPLDGAPRKVTSGLGDVRGDGHHAHRGVDFDSIRGEPVRAVADGRVVYAGVASRRVPPDRTKDVSSRRMGRGGLFLLVEHTPELVSAYMHLGDYVVSEGERVKGGQLIAHVGRTGIKHDPAHLHFELRRANRRPIDPTPLLASSVFGRDATYLGQMILAAQPRMWRHVRYMRWLRRQKAKARTAGE
jgi:murein DD-endopeptidase MepM/ murein hydrolase activator NlpD